MSAPGADLEVLQRVMREGGVDQTPATPGLSDYFLAVLEAGARWLHQHVPGAHWLDPVARGLGKGLTAVGLALAVVVLGLAVRMVLAGRRSRASRGLATAAPRTVAPAPSAPERSRLEWRAEIERRLGMGDVGAALEALWWWFARGVCAARVDPAWTSRELLDHAGRPDLASLARGLDRLLYAAERPEAGDVRAFLLRSEESLA